MTPASIIKKNILEIQFLKIKKGYKKKQFFNIYKKKLWQ